MRVLVEQISKTYYQEQHYTSKQTNLAQAKQEETSQTLKKKKKKKKDTGPKNYYFVAIAD
jgi:hypothetical protein